MELRHYSQIQKTKLHDFFATRASSKPIGISRERMFPIAPPDIWCFCCHELYKLPFTNFQPPSFIEFSDLITYLYPLFLILFSQAGRSPNSGSLSKGGWETLLELWLYFLILFYFKYRGHRWYKIALSKISPNNFSLTWLELAFPLFYIF